MQRTEASSKNVYPVLKERAREEMGAFDSSSSKRCLSTQAKIVLYIVTGSLLMLAAVSVLIYLRATVPANYVWATGMKLLVAAGIGGSLLSGTYLLARAKEIHRIG